MKTVCAFANGQGVSVLFGVDDDDGSSVDPRPELHFDDLSIDSQSMVVLEMRWTRGPSST